MIADKPLLCSFALNGVLADIEGASHVDQICRASPLDPAEVRRILYYELGLKTLPSVDHLTAELVDRACELLRISRAEFPYGILPLAPYRLRPTAVEAVAAAAAHMDTAIITNTSVFAEPCLAAVRDELTPHLGALHASWSLGAAKPDYAAFRESARRHGTDPEHVVNVGHSWHKDIVPVLALGGRAVWLNYHTTLIPGSEPVPPGRLLVAPTLLDAVEQIVRRWIR